MTSTMKNIVRLIRPKQWVKNFLLFAGLIFSDHFTEPDRIGKAGLAFLVYCLFASTIYIINDLHDVESDKLHPRKKHRPLAAGQVTRSQAIALAGIFGVVGLVLTVVLFGWRFQAITLSYFVLMFLYTFWLKHQVILDLMVISAGFVIRSVAGIYAIEYEGEVITITPWFITCIMFLSLFVVICKRRHEITLLSDGAVSHRPVLEHYSTLFLDQMINVATTATVISYALYVTLGVQDRPGGNYMVLTLPYVLYGVFRYLYLVYQKDEGGAPESLLFHDKVLLITVVLWLLTVILIMYV